MQATKEKTKAARPVRLKKRWDMDDTELSILALPTTVWFICFAFLPMIGIIIAFKDYKISGGFLQNMLQSEWVGFKNFKFLFSTGDIWLILRNTVLYNIVFIILGIVLPVGAARLLRKGRAHISLTEPSHRRAAARGTPAARARPERRAGGSDSAGGPSARARGAAEPLRQRAQCFPRPPSARARG